MKKFFAAAALLASSAMVSPASAATLIKGTILFNSSGVTATPHSGNGLNANFQFEVAEPYAAGDPAIPTISNFLYFLGSSTIPVPGVPQVQFYQVGSGGMFDLQFGSHVINIYGIDIGSGGSVTPGFFFPPQVISVGVNYVTGKGMGTVSATPIAPVPEPATWGLMLAGFAAVGVAMRRRQNVRVSFA